jgi:hypothetical protein
MNKKSGQSHLLKKNYSCAIRSLMRNNLAT